MVNRFRNLALSAAIVFLGVLAGCDKTSSPVVPSGEAVLNLSIPKFVLNSKPSSAVLKKLHAKNTLPDSSQGTLKYCLTADGQAPLKGSIDFASGSDVGTVTIPLPRAGRWIVAAEWFYTGDGIIPEFAGADAVTVTGTTSFALNMENFSSEGYSCYYPFMADAGYDFCSGNSYNDTYLFDSGTYGFIANGSLGDIQTAYDSPSGSEYLIAPATSSSPVSFAYLGNGDLVNFATVPDDAAYYGTTLEAKAAVVGSAASMMAPGDVYVVRGVVTPNGNSGKVWLQLDSNSPYICTGGSSNGGFISFWFIYNAEGFNFMKFDETTYGHSACNQNVIST